MPPVRIRAGDYDTTYAHGYRRYAPYFVVSGARQHFNPYYWVARSDAAEYHVPEPLGGGRLKRRLPWDTSLYDSRERGAKRARKEVNRGILAISSAGGEREMVNPRFMGSGRNGGSYGKRYKRNARNPFLRSRSFRRAVKRVISERLGDIEQIINTTGYVEATQGRQGVNSSTDTGVTRIWDRDDIVKQLTALPANVVPSGGTGSLNYKFIAKKCSISFNFTNPGNVALEVWWYHVVPTHDNIVESPVTSWIDGMGEEANTGGGGAGATVNDIGTTPFMSRVFVKEWHVVKVLKYHMNPGDVRNFKFTWKRPKVSTFGDWNDGADNVESVRSGFTHAWFPVIRGQTAAVENDATQVSTSAGTLIWSASKRYSLQVLEGNEELQQVALNSNFNTTAALEVRDEANPDLLEPVDPN